MCTALLFVSNIVAKYADELDLDSMPEPDEYLKKRDMLEAYKFISGSEGKS